jgi:phospholipase C
VTTLAATLIAGGNAMSDQHRRSFLKLAAGAVAGSTALGAMPQAIREALAIPARQTTGTIRDVEHIVILMQENRSFDHYFGTMRGVRGFGDRHPIPLPGGRNVWRQRDGDVEVTPFHLNTQTTDALRVPGTPHSFADAQGAWGQGKLEEWPRYKTHYSMGYYKRDDIPFQFALAEGFTICDAYHCSVTAGTDPNRIVFWSGAGFDPEKRAKGENCTDEHSEPDNFRCWVKGALPKPGYTYVGNSLKWPTIPDVLQKAGVSWRIYQDPNNNWTGAMHGGLAFESFRTSRPGSALYDQGMSQWSLTHLQQHVHDATLPAVSWILPSPPYSEHPSASTPLEGAEFTARILQILTSNPDIWSKTAFFLTFDENDGLFDHLPAAAPPSFNRDGTLAGKATFNLAGHYLLDPDRKHLAATDMESGTIRPFGLGPRVPMYVVSPWSKGGWVTSQVFDHTSVGRFLEKRFDVTIPAISPWHRAVCGDLTSAFDFAAPNDPVFPDLPNVSGASAVVLEHIQKPRILPPDRPEPLKQEPGVRPSRALPYDLDAIARLNEGERNVSIVFHNTGKVGAVFHVYDRLHLDRIPQRYTVEAGKKLDDQWNTSADDGNYDLAVYGPNGFFRSFTGAANAQSLDVDLQYRKNTGSFQLILRNNGKSTCTATCRQNAYAGPNDEIEVLPGKSARREWLAADSGHWYDVTVSAGSLVRRLAGRVETGKHGISDPALGS